MSVLSRRDFLSSSASLALTSTSAFAAMGPNDKFDLVIKGGDVLDPSQNAARQARHRHPLRDDRGGRGRHPGRAREARARCRRQAGDARPDRPALHVFPYGSAIGIPADELVAHQGTTTCVSAGDAGANNFAAFRRHIAAQTRTRLYAFVHIANIGLARLPGAGALQHRLRAGRRGRAAVAENADMVLGIKVRMSRERDRQARPRAAQARDRGLRAAGTGAKVMCHIGGVETRELMSQILDLLRAGRHAHPLLFGRAEHRRRVHQHRAGRQAAAGRARGEAARRDLRRRPRRRQLRLHGRRGRDPAGRATRHDLVGHPRVLRQHARHAVPAPG